MKRRLTFPFIIFTAAVLAGCGGATGWKHDTGGPGSRYVVEIE